VVGRDLGNRIRGVAAVHCSVRDGIGVAFQKKTQNAQAPLTRRTQKDAGRAGGLYPPES